MTWLIDIAIIVAAVNGFFLYAAWVQYRDDRKFERIYGRGGSLSWHDQRPEDGR